MLYVSAKMIRYHQEAITRTEKAEKVLQL
jgi:hypothetical protein